MTTRIADRRPPGLQLVLTGFLVLWLILAAFPFLWTFWGSFKVEGDFFSKHRLDAP
jgi:trehalose/maltose transport system permease protein